MAQAVEEWQTQVELAAVYRLVALYGVPFQPTAK